MWLDGEGGPRVASKFESRAFGEPVVLSETSRNRVFLVVVSAKIPSTAGATWTFRQPFRQGGIANPSPPRIPGSTPALAQEDSDS